MIAFVPQNLSHFTRVSCLLLLIYHECNGQTQCYGEFACTNTTIVETSGDIDCYGSGSCARSSINNIGSSNDGRTTACWGGRSCQKAPSFSGTVELSSDIGGYLGLAWTKYVDTDELQCLGEGSCYQIENATSNQLWCSGFRSCDGIYSDNSRLILAYGALSLQNSILRNPSLVYLLGFFSGYNTTVYCQSNYSCYISCYNNGCENLRFICDNEATCLVYCNYAPGVTCPNGWNASSIYNNNNDYWVDDQSANYQLLKSMSSLFGDYILNNETIANAYKKNKFDSECDENGSTRDDIICGNNTECKSMSMRSKNNVCCTGYASCQYSITEHFDNVYCDASDACFDRIMNGTIDGINGLKLSNIYARGQYGARYGSINNFNFMMATGQSAASHSMIEFGNHLACFGITSCHGATITSVTNIYGCGQYAMYYSTIVSGGIGEMNVYLLGEDSGFQMSINCTVGDVCNIYCINSECDDNTGNIICDPVGDDCDINWFYSLPTNSPTKSPIPRPREPTSMPTTASITTRTTSDVTRTSSDSISTNNITLVMTIATDATTSMSQEIVYSTTDEESDTTNEQGITDDYVLYMVLLALLVIMAICSGCLCWQKLRDNQRKNNKNNEEETISIRAHGSINHESKIRSISPASPASPRSLGLPTQGNITGDETKNDSSVVSTSVDQFSEGGDRNSINTMVTENEGVHLQVEHGNGNPLLHDDYTQEGGDDHGVTIADEKENNYDANDNDIDVLKESGDTMRSKGEMFKQDLNDEVVVENALVDDIVGHMATSHKSDI